MDAALVIPTLGDNKLLSSIFDSITRFVNDPVDIIIVRQTNHGPLPENLEVLQRVHDVRCYDVNFRGLSLAKNFAIDHCTRKHIVFLDDDAEMLPETFSVLKRIIGKTEFVGCFGKTIDKAGNDTVSKFSTESAELSLDNYLGRIIECPSIFLTATVAQYRFDEKMGAGQFHGAEEGHDLVLRMLKAGEKLFYTPELAVYHPNKTVEFDTPQALRRAFHYRAGFAYLCAKHSLLSRLVKRCAITTLALPYFAVFRREKLKFYIAELLGMASGYLLR